MAIDIEAFRQKCEEAVESLHSCEKESLSREDRAHRILQVQERTRILRGLGTKNTHAEVLATLEKELQRCAKEVGVKLKPPKWHFPPGLRDFDYFHTVRDVPSREPETENQGQGVGLERNLLIVLHGFGGRKEPFSSLPQKFSLPTTAFLIPNAPQALPEELLDDPPGYSWFDTIDEDTGDFIPAMPEERRRMDSLATSVALLWRVVDVLITYCGWQHHELFLFGYGQGGTVALDMLLRPPPQQPVLGSVIAVAAEVLPEERSASSTSKGLQVPVLLINGARDECVSQTCAEASARHLQQVLRSSIELQIFKDRGAEMLRGHHEAESRCFMTFLSDHLNGVGRKGSAEATAEAMRKIGAELVGESAAGEHGGFAPAVEDPQVSSGHSLNEMD